LPGRNKNEKYLNIKKKKMETSLDYLCLGKPSCFKEYMEICRALKFAEQPDYALMKGLFEGCMKKMHFDASIPNYKWTVAALAKDKEALKESIVQMIKKRPVKLDIREEVDE